jgi:tetratricopeptide (TPR) repeat protein
VEALSDFDAALALDPASYKAAYYRAMTLQVSSDYAGAIQGFTRSLEINPYQPYCLFRRAQAYYHVGDYPAALSDCEAALSINPDLKNAYDFRRLLQSQLDFSI